MWDTFTVRICLNGLIVKVGCQRLIFNNAEEFALALSSYLNDPEGTIEKWQKKKNAKISLGAGLNVGVAAPPPPPPPGMGFGFGQVRGTGENLGTQSNS